MGRRSPIGKIDQRQVYLSAHNEDLHETGEGDILPLPLPLTLPLNPTQALALTPQARAISSRAASSVRTSRSIVRRPPPPAPCAPAPTPAPLAPAPLPPPPTHAPPVPPPPPFLRPPKHCAYPPRPLPPASPESAFAFARGARNARDRVLTALRRRYRHVRMHLKGRATPRLRGGWNPIHWATP